MSGWAPPREEPIAGEAEQEKPRTFPVIEIFGPTIQGEGVVAGVSTYFVRFGGCDYRCSWCDSMYAVEPEQVRANAMKLTNGEILDHIEALPLGPEWVTLSGGNPALLHLDSVVDLLQEQGYKVAVETQGSKWRDWLGAVDCLTVSPKPPSSLMARRGGVEFPKFMRHHEPRASDALKIVVFDEADYDWARGVFEQYPRWPAFLSVGTDPVTEWGAEWIKTVHHRDVLAKIAERYAWLCDRAAADRAMANVRVLPQLHVVAYGHQRGV